MGYYFTFEVDWLAHEYQQEHSFLYYNIKIPLLTFRLEPTYLI